MMNMIKKEKGFTLIELMIVVAIIGILAAIAIPQFASYRVKAFNSAAKADLHSAQTAFEVFFNDNSIYPTAVTVTATSPITLAGGTTGGTVNLSNGVSFGSTVKATTSASYGAATKHVAGDGYYKTTSGAPTIVETITAAKAGVALVAADLPAAP